MTESKSPRQKSRESRLNPTDDDQDRETTPQSILVDFAAGLRKRENQSVAQERVRFNRGSVYQNAKVEEPKEKIVILQQDAGKELTGLSATTKRSNILLDAAKAQGQAQEQSPRKKQKGKLTVKRADTKRGSAAKQRWGSSVLKVVCINRVVAEDVVQDRRRGGVSLTDGESAATGEKLTVRNEIANVLASSHEMMVENELLSMPIFAKCSQEFVKALSVSAKSHRFNAGNIIATQGNLGSSIIIVLRGAVDMLVSDQKVSTLIQGQYFGETLLLGLEKYWAATLQVAATCVVCEITRESFLLVAERYPPGFAFEAIVAKNKDCLSDGTLVNTCIVFNGLSDRSMCDIDNALVRRIIFPGEAVLHEGTPGDEMYILVRGTAHVKIAGRLVRVEKRSSLMLNEAPPMDSRRSSKRSSDMGAVAAIPDPGDRRRSTTVEASAQSGLVCFGELGLLGLQDTRTATVVADTVLHVRVLYRPVFRKILDDHGDSIGSHELMRVFQERYKHRIPPLQLLRSVPIFVEVGCSEPFLDFLAQHLEDRIFMPGQKIIDEHNPDDRCMYLIVEGKAKVIKEGVEVTTLSNGAVCGEIIVLGLASKRTATVVAEESCFLQVLHQSVVVRGLELFPDERKRVLMMAFKGHAMHQAREAHLTRVAVDAMGPTHTDGQQHPGQRSPRSPKTPRTPMTPRSPSKRAAARKSTDLRSQRSKGDLRIELDSPSMAKGSSSQRIGDLEVSMDAPQEGVDGVDSAARKTLVQRSLMSQALQGSPLFADIGTAFIKELSQVATDRIYMPGDMIIEQGKKGDSMFVMVSGTAAVYVVDEKKEGGKAKSTVTMDEDGDEDKASTQKVMSRVGSLTGGSVGGELAMLGVSQTRSATIEAETICSMWEITQEEALPIIERFPDAQKHFANIIIEHLERTVPTRILSLPLFRGFDRKFRTLLGIYSERRAYFPGQQIVREGQTGERLYIVNLGRVRLEKKAVNVKMYASGSHFGSSVMLGIHKAYMGTLFALQTCHVLVITRRAYQAALEQYPSLGAAQEMCRAEKINEEILREAVQRSATRKLIWKRYQLLILDPTHGTSPFAHGDRSDAEILERCLRGWHSLTKYSRERRDVARREHRQRKEHMKIWLRKRAEAKERARMRREKEHMDVMPDHLRGGPEIKDPAVLDVKQSVTLPPVPKSPGELRRRDLEGFMKDWPGPRPSPHYRLRVYGVLKDAVVDAPSTASPLLPLLVKNNMSILKSQQNKTTTVANTVVECTTDEEEGEDCPPAPLLGEAPQSIKDKRLSFCMSQAESDSRLGSGLDESASSVGSSTSDDEDESGQDGANYRETPLPSNGETPMPGTCAVAGSELKLPPIHNDVYSQDCPTPPMSASSMHSAAGVRLQLL